MNEATPRPMRPKGHRTIPTEKRVRFGASHPTAAAAPFGAAAALRQFKGKTFDQGQTLTCFGHATAKGILIALAAAGTPLGFEPSPLRVARDTLSEEQGPPPAPLQDIGANLADVSTAVTREGLRPMGPLAPDGRYSDVTPENIVQREGLAEDVQGAAELAELVLDLEFLDPFAPDFLAQVATSIANLKCTVSLGIHANPAFEYWQAGSPALTDATGFTDKDGHDVIGCDFRTNETTGALEFWLLSSWGDSFGEDGGAWVDGQWLLKACIQATRLKVARKVAAAKVGGAAAVAAAIAPVQAAPASHSAGELALAGELVDAKSRIDQLEAQLLNAGNTIQTQLTMLEEQKATIADHVATIEAHEGTIESLRKRPMGGFGGHGA